MWILAESKQKFGLIVWWARILFDTFSRCEKLLPFSDLKVQSVALQSKEQRKTSFSLVLCSLIRNFFTSEEVTFTRK